MVSDLVKAAKEKRVKESWTFVAKGARSSARIVRKKESDLQRNSTWHKMTCRALSGTSEILIFLLSLCFIFYFIFSSHSNLKKK